MRDIADMSRAVAIMQVCVLGGGHAQHWGCLTRNSTLLAALPPILAMSSPFYPAPLSETRMIPALGSR